MIPLDLFLAFVACALVLGSLSFAAFRLFPRNPVAVGFGTAAVAFLFALLLVSA